MQKAKFQIKGMHCGSCSKLIEEKLKKHDGITMIKANHESGKAVAVYDKNKIKEEKIIELIEKVGDFKVEKKELEQETSLGINGDFKVEKEELKQKASLRINKNSDKLIKPQATLFNSSTILGVFVGISLVSVITNIILLIVIFKLS